MSTVNVHSFPSQVLRVEVLRVAQDKLRMTNWRVVLRTGRLNPLTEHVNPYSKPVEGND